jgi:hypothetical protein
MIAYLTDQLVAIVNSLGGFVFTFCIAACFVVYIIARSIQKETSISAKNRHEEATIAESNRHLEKIALIQSNDPKLIEGLNKRVGYSE